MVEKLHTHKVVLGDRHGANKRTSGMRKHGTSKGPLREIFDTYYRNQVRALYRVVSKGK
ncbi:MAG: hypothetical protein ABH844_06410 [Candidatus Omnitrophota bacterium]